MAKKKVYKSYSKRAEEDKKGKKGKGKSIILWILIPIILIAFSLFGFYRFSYKSDSYMIDKTYSTALATATENDVEINKKDVTISRNYDEDGNPETFYVAYNIDSSYSVIVTCSFTDKEITSLEAMYLPGTGEDWFNE